MSWPSCPLQKPFRFAITRASGSSGLEFVRSHCRGLPTGKGRTDRNVRGIGYWIAAHP